MTAHKPRPKGVPLVAGILLFAAMMVVLYWVMFFSGSGAVTNEDWYMIFERAFPAADAWLAITALLGCVGLLRRKPWGVLFTLLAGSASIFLGLMDVLFDLENRIYTYYFALAPGEVSTEIAINMLTLVLGPVLIWYVWTRRESLL